MEQSRPPNERGHGVPSSQRPGAQSPRRRCRGLGLGCCSAPASQSVRSEADRVYIAVGIGETFEAIDALLTAIAREGIPLGRDVVAIATPWLDCYRGQDAETGLRHLLEQVKSISPQRESAFGERFGAALIAARDRRSG